MKIRDVKERLEVHHADLSGSSFTDVNLSGAAYTDINMSGSSFDDINMSGWRVDKVNLAGLKAQPRQSRRRVDQGLPARRPDHRRHLGD